MIPSPRNFAFPNFIPGKYRLPPDFKLWPDHFPGDLPPSMSALASLPQTPPIPPTVATGDVITASHENTVTTALNDLWIDVQWLAANSAGVTSVFGRTGAIVAASGDYTAAQVTNAVSSASAYADPAWITSLAWGKVAGAPATYPPAAHTHPASDIVSGIIAAARLGSGVADSTKFLRGDGSWQIVRSTIGVTIDGGGAALIAGQKGYVQVPYAATITGWSITADQAGSISVDIDKHASSAPPAAPAEPNTTTDKISANAPVALSSAVSASGGAAEVSTWTTTVAQWDVIGFNVTSASTLQRATVLIYVTRS